ncbi:hypothetical protein MLD38_011490 [Melastoma candidum]|nr:hypothetical protein MLD38_011490 [Melastoma candidum]
MAQDRLLDRKTFLVSTRTFAEVRELKKCVEVFHLANRNGWEYSLDTINMVVENLCRRKLVEEAHHLVVKLKKEVAVLQPDAVTYGWLVKGYCEAGDLIAASKLWNLMADEGLEPDVWVCEVMMETLFKTNRFGDAMGIFHMMRIKMMDRLGISTFRIVMRWLGKVGKVRGSYMVFVELLKRGIKDDDSAMSSMIYGLLARGRVREARKVFDQMKSNLEISVYHGIIKGLLKLRRASEATCIFREMISRGCEPTMHTYIMLLQGHLGKRGRKGPDTLANFDSIFVGGLVKAGKSLEATKYVERTMDRSLEVPRFDYNKFLHYYSNDEGVAFFEEVSKKLREAGMVDLADILSRYGEKMATRDRRRDRPCRICEDGHEVMV